MTSRRLGWFLVAGVGIAATVALVIWLGPREKQPVVAEDLSLSVEQYGEKGLPPPDRPWTGKDYPEAAEVLQAVKSSDPRQLPRWNSTVSGAVFSRMVAPENLGSLEDPATPVAKRMNLMNDYLVGVKQLTSLYVTVEGSTEFDVEVVELTGLTFRLIDVSRKVMVDFVATVDPIDPTFEVRRQSVKRIDEGAGQIYGGATHILLEREFYRVTARKRMAEHLHQHLPALFSHLPPLWQRIAKENLVEATETEADGALRNTIQTVLDNLPGG